MTSFVSKIITVAKARIPEKCDAVHTFKPEESLSYLVPTLVSLIYDEILLLPTVTYNVQDGAGGAVSYWLLAFLLAANIAGVLHMRRWAAAIKSREDKE